jgi:hypothetical protein
VYTKLVGIAIFSLFVLMIIPAYGNVTSISLEKNFYIVDEKIIFLGNEDEGNKLVNVIISDSNGNIKLLGGVSNSEGEFKTIPQPIENIFTIIGTYDVIAFVDKIEDGISILLKFDGQKVSEIYDFVLQLDSIQDRIIDVEKTVVFTVSIIGSSPNDVIFSLDNEPTGATIDENSGKFVWTPTKSHGNVDDVKYNFDIIVKSGDQEDIENITITVKKAYDEPKIEPVPIFEEEPKNEIIDNGLASFVDETKDPQSYVDRYNNEVNYKEWFDKNYSQYVSIYEAVGLEEPTVESDINCGVGTELVNGMCQIIQTEEPTKKGGGCLIATATYGSEMAPQVQFLREIRDNQLMNTDSGISFMTSFNQFYYSFSPIIADMERENPIFKETIKIGLTPLLSSLTIMSLAESELEVLGYGVGVILANIGMYFAIPIMLFYSIKKIKRVKF